MPAAAEIVPQPVLDNPRIQQVQWVEGEVIALAALTGTPLTVVLEPGDEITRVTLSDDRSWAVKVSSDRDSFTILPDRAAMPAMLTVATAAHVHEFSLALGTGDQPAYLVSLKSDPIYRAQANGSSPPGPGEIRFSYKLRGDDKVRPSELFDDGSKTWISFADHQPLPAVFAIGPSGDEQVVNGYMRQGYFVIDRVHEELIFRIDKEKAKAHRLAQRGQE